MRSKHRRGATRVSLCCRPPPRFTWGAVPLANISGAMMTQATVPSGLGLLFTPWRFDTALLISGLATMAAIGYLLILMRTRRLTASVGPVRGWCHGATPGTTGLGGHRLVTLSLASCA